MMLPNGSRAVVDVVKLRDYCLSLEHPRGRHKARVFAAALGLTASDADWLRLQLHIAASSHETVATTGDSFGQRYLVDFPLLFRSRSVIVRSCWIVRRDEDFPRLTSCFVK